MRAKNESTIQNAFTRFIRITDEVIRAGMYRVLENGVKVALAAHNEKHQSHIEMGDTYGWVLVHNGHIEELVVVANSDNRGNASDQLEKKARSLPKIGWIGVVMAGMQPASYFSVTYEIGTLEHAKNVTLVNFFQYFRPI